MSKEIPWWECSPPEAYCPTCEKRSDIMATKNDRIEELQALLREIANIAHHGGLINKDGNDIRKLTLPYWDIDECDRLQRQSSTRRR